MTETSITLQVPLPGRAYDIQIGTDVLASAGQFITGRLTVTHAVVITDLNVETPHATAVAESLAEYADAVDLALVDPGESSKSLEVAAGLWNTLIEMGADRKSVVVAVGGGVVGDLAGFIAATFARGVPFIQVPTTLLAHVDSSVGGKVGINLPDAKNMVGAFWQPRGVLIDTATLATLPQREYRAGLAEVVKYGVILDADFFSYLEDHVEQLNARDDDVLRHVIHRCCQLKADVVTADERDETGRRAVLNYGHTFGHALEALTGYEQLLHGEGVALGMRCAARLAHRLGRVDAGFTSRQDQLLDALGLTAPMPDLDHDAILEAMSRDKKVEHGRLRFVLPSRLGHVELVGEVAPDHVRAALQP